MSNTRLEELQREMDLLKSQKCVFPDENEKTRAPKATIKNLVALLDHYNVSLKYNEMTHSIEFTFPNEKFHEDLEYNVALAHIASLAAEQNLPQTNLGDYVVAVASANPYHPVKQWIDTVEWDGQSRLDDFYKTIVCNNEDEEGLKLKHTLMYKWALSAVAALYDYNFSNEGILCLYGAQGIGKTSWAFSLMPHGKAEEWIKDGVTLNVNDKDSRLLCVNTWITELGELAATFKKSDIEALKAWATQKSDVIRPAYAKVANKYKRRTVFYATINSQEFLQDNENRRFWVLDVQRFNVAKYDVGQFWSEMKHYYYAVKANCATVEDRMRTGEYGWFLTPTEREFLHQKQNPYKTIEPTEELLENHVLPLKQMDNGKAEWLNCTAIARGIGINNVTKRETNIISQWLRDKGYKRQAETKKFLVQVTTSILERDEERKTMLQGKLLQFSRVD